MTIGTSVGGMVAEGTGALDGNGNDTVVQIWGLWHFNATTNLGTTVSVQMLGQDCGDFTVASDGSVKVPLQGTTFAGSTGVVKLTDIVTYSGVYDIQQSTPLHLTIANVSTFLNIPIVIGRAFVSQGQRLRAATAEDIRSPTGPALGKVRRTHQFAALVVDAVKVQFGTSLTPTPLGNMDYAVMQLQGDQGGTLGVGQTYTGVYRGTVEAPGDFDDMFCWQVDRPWPFTITAVSSFLVSEDRLDEQK
jgi:hypothetical protein